MYVGGTSSGLPPLFGARLELRTPKTLERGPQGEGSARAGLGDLVSGLDRLRRGLRGLKIAARIRGGPRGMGLGGLARSAAGVGLDVSRTATTLTSTGEVNATPTSFTPFSPSFAGGSTAAVTIGGAYDGSLGDDTLTFEARRGGAVGINTVIFAVKDSSGGLVDAVTFLPSDPPGTEKTLNSGLTMSLSAGAIELLDTFEVSVSASTGSSVDPDKPFDGTGNDIPNFEPGVTVGAGSFTVNGVVISVAASDTIHTVLSKITNSAAGVNATFDAASETVRLEQQTLGAGTSIVVGNDTSGFLDAVKLTDAVQDEGSNGDLRSVLRTVPALAGIVNGSFQVNNTTILVDVTTDSLQDVLDRITSDVEGVTASYDVATDRVRIEADAAGGGVLLTGDTSGLLEAVGIEEGSYRGAGGAGSALGFRDREALRQALDELAQRLVDLSTSEFDVLTGSHAQEALRTLSDAFDEALDGVRGTESRAALEERFGLSFDANATDGKVLSLDRNKLAEAIDKDADPLARFLAGDGAGEPGLLARFETALEELTSGLAAKLAPGEESGLLLDTVA